MRSSSVVANGVAFSPVSAATINMQDNVTSLILTPAGTLATLTVKFPNNAWDGQEIAIKSTQIITALTLGVQNGGHTISDTITALSVNGYARYTINQNKWYRTG